MQMGNQYGINMGNILSTASNIETAKLNRKINQEKLDTVVAGKKLKANYLSTSNGGKPLYDENQVNALTQQDPDTAIKLQMDKQLEQQTQGLEKYYESQGYAPQIAHLMSIGKYKQVVAFNKDFRAKTKDQQEQIKNNIGVFGTAVHNIIGMATKDPMGAEKTYQNIRSELTNKATEYYKNGQKEQGDKLLKTINDYPKTLLKQDGSFNFGEANVMLGTLSSMASNADTLLKTTQEETKNKDAINFEKIKQKNRVSLEDKKQKDRERLKKLNPRTKLKLQKLFEYKAEVKKEDPNSPKLKIIDDAIKLTSQGKSSPLDKYLALQLGLGDNGETDEQKKEDNKDTSINVTDSKSFHDKWGF